MQLTELNRPLGQDRPVASGRPWGRWLATAAAGCVGAAILGLVLTVALRRDPDGGEPMAVAAIEKRAAPVSSAPANPGPVAATPQGPASAAQLEHSAGVTVTRAGEDAPEAIVITIPDEARTQKLATAPDNRLVERSRYGLLPKVGPEGATPANIYARPLGPEPATKPAAARQLPRRPGRSQTSRPARSSESARRSAAATPTPIPMISAPRRQYPATTSANAAMKIAHSAEAIQPAARPVVA